MSISSISCIEDGGISTFDFSFALRACSASNTINTINTSLRFEARRAPCAKPKARTP